MLITRRSQVRDLYGPLFLFFLLAEMNFRTCKQMQVYKGKKRRAEFYRERREDRKPIHPDQIPPWSGDGDLCLQISAARILWFSLLCRATSRFLDPKGNMGAHCTAQCPESGQGALKSTVLYHWPHLLALKQSMEGGHCTAL